MRLLVGLPVPPGTHFWEFNLAAFFQFLILRYCKLGIGEDSLEFSRSSKMLGLSSAGGSNRRYMVISAQLIVSDWEAWDEALIEHVGYSEAIGV